MSDAEDSGDVAGILSLEPFAALVGEEIAEFVFEAAPRKVGSRVGKALDHYSKALKLKGVDDEMGALRCIAAEEELVVSIFEWLKLNTDTMPEHRDFIGSYKNHRVKLAFYPVLSQFRFVLGDMVRNGITFDGFEDLTSFKLWPVLHHGSVKLQIEKENGENLVKVNPLAISVNWNDRSDEDVVAELFKDFSKTVADQQRMTVREFVSVRAEYRNKLLYAEDAGFLAMAETLDELIENTFSTAYRDLLWCLAALLGNKPVHPKWGLVSQFIALYRRVLVEAKVIKSQQQIEIGASG